jgi:hypothetical protein
MSNHHKRHLNQRLLGGARRAVFGRQDHQRNHYQRTSLTENASDTRDPGRVKEDVMESAD